MGQPVSNAFEQTGPRFNVRGGGKNRSGRDAVAEKILIEFQRDEVGTQKKSPTRPPCLGPTFEGDRSKDAEKSRGIAVGIRERGQNREQRWYYGIPFPAGKNKRKKTGKKRRRKRASGGDHSDARYQGKGGTRWDALRNYENILMGKKEWV